MPVLININRELRERERAREMHVLLASISASAASIGMTIALVFTHGEGLNTLVLASMLSSHPSSMLFNPSDIATKPVVKLHICSNRPIRYNRTLSSICGFKRADFMMCAKSTVRPKKQTQIDPSCSERARWTPRTAAMAIMRMTMRTSHWSTNSPGTRDRRHLCLRRSRSSSCMITLPRPRTTCA